MVLICLYNLIMNVGRMWGECGEECEDECGDQCGDSFTVVKDVPIEKLITLVALERENSNITH